MRAMIFLDYSVRIPFEIFPIFKGKKIPAAPVLTGAHPPTAVASLILFRYSSYVRNRSTILRRIISVEVLTFFHSRNK